MEFGNKTLTFFKFRHCFFVKTWHFSSRKFSPKKSSFRYSESNLLIKSVNSLFFIAKSQWKRQVFSFRSAILIFSVSDFKKCLLRSLVMKHIEHFRWNLSSFKFRINIRKSIIARSIPWLFWLQFANSVLSEKSPLWVRILTILQPRTSR